MSFTCDHCWEDCSDSCLADSGNDELYCDACWPKVQVRIAAREEHYKRIGHTGSDMCGCSMCAARFEQG